MAAHCQDPLIMGQPVPLLFRISSPLQCLWSLERIHITKAETGAPVLEKPLGVCERDSGHINYLCSADRNLIQAYVQRESNQQLLYSLYSLCSIVH